MINTLYSIKTYQECVVLMKLIDRRGYNICYTDINVNFIEIDHMVQQATFSDKADLSNKIVASTLTEFVKRL